MCTACLHGTSAFPYQAQPTTYSLSNTVVNSANLACHHQQVLNPFSELIYNPLSTSVDDHLLVPNFNTENRVVVQNNSIEINNEIDSWLVLDPGIGEEQEKNGPLYKEANKNMDRYNWPCSDQIEYQNLYDNLQQTESQVPVHAVELADQAHYFNVGPLEHEAFKANNVQTPSSRLTVSTI